MEAKVEGLIGYFAGIFDGEGCVLITRRDGRKGRSVAHQLQASVKMLDGAPARAMHARYGGTLGVAKRETSDYPFVNWVIRDRLAQRFLSEIRPYCMVKGPQIDLGLEFMTLKNSQRKGFGSEHRLKNDEIVQRDEMKRQMSLLKREHVA